MAPYPAGQGAGELPCLACAFLRFGGGGQLGSLGEVGGFGLWVLVSVLYAHVGGAGVGFLTPDGKVLGKLAAGLFYKLLLAPTVI